MNAFSQQQLEENSDLCGFFHHCSFSGYFEAALIDVTVIKKIHSGNFSTTAFV